MAKKKTKRDKPQTEVTPKRDYTPAPGRGTRVSDDTIAAFRAAYLKHGYIAAAAREVGLPESTCAPYASQADVDPTFVRARAELLSRGLSRVEAMVLRASELAAERIEKGPQIDASGCIVDTGPAYYRGLTDAHRALVARRKIDDDRARAEGGADATGPIEITIKMVAPEQEEASNNEPVKS